MESARVLEKLPERDTVELFAGLETSTAGLVLEAMLPSGAARVVRALPVDASSELLSELPPRRASEILRLLDADARQSRLERMSEEPRRAAERMLRFPAGTAGALMEPRVVAFHLSRTASQALEEIRERALMVRFYVYVVDDRNVLRGALSIRELLNAPPDARLDAVMRQPAESLSARAGGRGILSHPAWKRLPLLPVVDEGGRLVGVFRYESLQALRGERGDTEEESPLGLALALGELFWIGASGLVRGLERK